MDPPCYPIYEPYHSYAKSFDGEAYRFKNTIHLCSAGTADDRRPPTHLFKPRLCSANRPDFPSPNKRHPFQGWKTKETSTKMRITGLLKSISRSSPTSQGMESSDDGYSSGSDTSDDSSDDGMNATVSQPPTKALMHLNCLTDFTNSVLQTRLYLLTSRHSQSHRSRTRQCCACP